MFICLASIWKSNAVKDYYGEMKLLENTRDELVKSNTHLRVRLTDAKSLDKISKAAAKLGLTYDVADRVYLKDPINAGSRIDRHEFVSSGDRIRDNVEEIMFRSGSALANPNEKQGK
jgi:predicted DNA binding CopG/RHH family protein